MTEVRERQVYNVQVKVGFLGGTLMSRVLA